MIMVVAAAAEVKLMVQYSKGGCCALVCWRKRETPNYGPSKKLAIVHFWSGFGCIPDQYSPNFFYHHSVPFKLLFLIGHFII